MNIPEKLFYTVEHEWVDFHQDEVTIGITDYAQSQLGDVIFVEFPKVGDIFSAGDPFESGLPESNQNRCPPRILIVSL